MLFDATLGIAAKVNVQLLVTEVSALPGCPSEGALKGIIRRCAVDGQHLSDAESAVIARLITQQMKETTGKKQGGAGADELGGCFALIDAVVGFFASLINQKPIQGNPQLEKRTKAIIQTLNRRDKAAGITFTATLNNTTKLNLRFAFIPNGGGSVVINDSMDDGRQYTCDSINDVAGCINMLLLRYLSSTDLEALSEYAYKSDDAMFGEAVQAYVGAWAGTNHLVYPSWIKAEYEAAWTGEEEDPLPWPSAVSSGIIHEGLSGERSDEARSLFWRNARRLAPHAQPTPQHVRVSREYAHNLTLSGMDATDAMDAMVAMRVRETDRVYIARTMTNDIVGFATCIVDATSKTVHVLNVWVSAQARRTGVCSKMFSHMEADFSGSEDVSVIAISVISEVAAGEAAFRCYVTPFMNGKWDVQVKCLRKAPIEVRKDNMADALNVVRNSGPTGVDLIITKRGSLSHPPRGGGRRPINPGGRKLVWRPTGAFVRLPGGGGRRALHACESRPRELRIKTMVPADGKKEGRRGKPAVVARFVKPPAAAVPVR